MQNIFQLEEWIQFQQGLINCTCIICLSVDMTAINYPRVVPSSGLFVGAIRPLQKLFYGSGGPQIEAPPLFFLIDSLSILAGAAIPGMMLVLGALLAYGPQRGVLPTRTILASIAVKQILVPAIGATCTSCRISGRLGIHLIVNLLVGICSQSLEIACIVVQFTPMAFIT